MNQYKDDRYMAICSERTLQTNSKGFFMNFAQLVSENAGQQWIKHVFGKLKTDKERIRIVYSHEQVCIVPQGKLENVLPAIMLHLFCFLFKFQY